MKKKIFLMLLIHFMSININAQLKIGKNPKSILSNGMFQVETNGLKSFLVDTNGKVGIGTNNPIWNLDVQSNSNSSIQLAQFVNVNSGLSSEAQIGLGAGIGAWTKLVGYNGTFGIRNYTSGNELLTIKTTGNIGINQTNPTSRLEVNGDVKIVDGTQGAGKVLTSDANGKASWQKSSGNLAANKPTLVSQSSSQWSITLNSNSFTQIPTFNTVYLDIGIYYVTIYQCPGQLTMTSSADGYWSLSSSNGGVGTGSIYYVPLASGTCGGYTNFIFKVQTPGDFSLSVLKNFGNPTFSASAGLNASIQAKIDAISL